MPSNLNPSTMGKLSWEKRKQKFGAEGLKERMRKAGEKGRETRYGKKIASE